MSVSSTITQVLQAFYVSQGVLRKWKNYLSQILCDSQGHVKKVWSLQASSHTLNTIHTYIHLKPCQCEFINYILEFKFPACTCLRGNCQYSVEMNTTVLRSEKGSVASTEPKKTTKPASRVSAYPCHLSCLSLKLRFCKCAHGGAHTTKKANWLYSQSGWTTH